jgi:alpha-glucuronidase
LKYLVAAKKLDLSINSDHTPWAFFCWEQTRKVVRGDTTHTQSPVVRQRAIATECNRILFGNSKKAAKSDRRVLMCIVQQSQEQASVRKLGWMVKPGSRRDDLKTR